MFFFLCYIELIYGCSFPFLDCTLNLFREKTIQLFTLNHLSNTFFLLHQMRDKHVCISKYVYFSYSFVILMIDQSNITEKRKSSCSAIEGEGSILSVNKNYNYEYAMNMNDIQMNFYNDRSRKCRLFVIIHFLFFLHVQRIGHRPKHFVYRCFLGREKKNYLSDFFF